MTEDVVIRLRRLPRQYREIGDAIKEIERLRIALAAAKRPHVSCDDCWYSCPKSEDGCCNPDEKDCNCGADDHNAAIDEALALTGGNEQGAT